MNKLTFPQGSLKFNKIVKDSGLKDFEKTKSWKDSLKEYAERRKYIQQLEQSYPRNYGANEEDEIVLLNRSNIPFFIQEQYKAHDKFLSEYRKKFKALPQMSAISNYEIIYKHPMWSKISDIGEIKINSNKESIKDSLKKISEEFKKKKDAYRKIRSRAKTTRIASLQSDITYSLSAGVIYMPKLKQGVFIQFLKDQEKKMVFSPKSPKESGKNYIGCEIEFFCDWTKDELGFKLYDVGVGKHVTLKGDGSIRPDADMISHELCVIAKEDEYKDVMKKICEVLAESNAQVNKSCGMHVHLDMRNRDAEQAYQNLISSQGILYRMNPESRGSEYAKRSKEKNFETAKSGDRYMGINATAHRKYSTIEVRIHAGTVDFTKITNWIAILVKIANHKERLTKTFVGINTFCEEFGIDSELESYIEERIKKFKPKKTGVQESDAERGVA